MKRTIFVAVIVVLAVGALGYTILTCVLQPVGGHDGVSAARGRHAAQFRATTAPITEITVQVGDAVRAGDVLVKQDTSALEATLAARRAALAADQVALQYQQDPFVPQDLQAAELVNVAAEAQLDAAEAKASETVGVQDSLVTRAANDVQAARDTLAADEQQAALNADVWQHGPGRERDGQPVRFRGWLRRHRADHAPAGHRGGTQPGAHELVQPARGPPDHTGPGACGRGRGRDYDQAVAKLQLSAGRSGRR